MNWASSFPILATILILTLLFLQPTSTEAAPNAGVRAAYFAPDPPIIKSQLYELQPLVVEIEAFYGTGGAIESLGDQLLLVTPKGRIAVIDAGGELNYLPQKVPMNEFAAREELIIREGLRVADILLHEQAAGSFRLFVSHHYFVEDCVEFRISSTLLNLDDGQARVSDSWKTEFIAEPCLLDDIFLFMEGGTFWPGAIQAGGRMLMDGAEHLLVVIGDHAWHAAGGYTEDTLTIAGPDSHLGKLVRIDLTNGGAEIVASGFRNPQGFARDADGDIWQTEHGPKGGDELNLLRPELNYGWPYVTHGLRYGDRTWPYSEVQGRHTGFEMPAFAWIPSIGISNIIVSDSQQFPLWQGDLLIASLRAQSLFRVRLYEKRVVYIEQIEVDTRIRDITQMRDGRIALLSDNAKVLFLQRAPIYCQDGSDIESIYSYDADDVCIDISKIMEAAEDSLIRSLPDPDFGSPVVRSLFNLYVHDDRLIYVKSPCSEEDFQNRFFLHITPVDVEDLSAAHVQHGFNVYDFDSYEENVAAEMNGAGCLVAYTLPEYEIKHIYTGQVIRVESADGQISWKGPVWEGSHTISDPSDAAAPQGGGVSAAAALFAVRCGACHNLVAEHYAGPHLDGVIGRRPGRVAGFNASAALTSLEIVWTRENLAEFIANPSQFAPGTSMSDTGITVEEAQIIADFLASER